MAVVISLNNSLGPVDDTVTAQKCSTKHVQMAHVRPGSTVQDGGCIKGGAFVRVAL